MVFLNTLYTCSLARKLIYGFLKYVKESMAGRVQDLITICVGSLWIEVPMGPHVGNNAESLRTTTTSSVVPTNNEQELNSKSKASFIHVVSKASKRRARKAAAAAKGKVATSKVCSNNVREVSFHSLAPCNLPKPSSVKTPRCEAHPSPHHTTLGEFPILMEKASTKKTTQCASAFSPPTPKGERLMAPLSPPTMSGARPL
jgi:hypothetical protein